MVTDSWVRARALMGRVLARSGAETTVIADLDDARTRLLLTGAPVYEHATSGMADEWQSRLGRLVETGTLTGEDLRALETSLRQLAAAGADGPATVHNTVSGGTQHGPIVQALHRHRPRLPIGSVHAPGTELKVRPGCPADDPAEVFFPAGYGRRTAAERAVLRRRGNRS